MFGCSANFLSRAITGGGGAGVMRLSAGLLGDASWIVGFTTSTKL